MVAPGHGPFGPEGYFFAPSFTGTYYVSQWRSFSIQLDQPEFPLFQSVQVNFAEPTSYSPQLNPEERLNADLKQEMGKLFPFGPKPNYATQPVLI